MLAAEPAVLPPALAEGEEEVEGEEGMMVTDEEMQQALALNEQLHAMMEQVQLQEQMQAMQRQQVLLCCQR